MQLYFYLNIYFVINNKMSRLQIDDTNIIIDNYETPTRFDIIENTIQETKKFYDNKFRQLIDLAEYLQKHESMIFNMREMINIQQKQIHILGEELNKLSITLASVQNKIDSISV